MRGNARSALGRLAAIALLALAGSGAAEAQPASTPNIYKVAKYPVQAQAEDAVTAKAQALADGQQGAFRALLKRLVPVTAYNRLPNVPLARIQDMIAGFSVRSERNSSTEYLASYDFEFQAKAVRELLRQSGLSVVEEVAQPTVLVAAYGMGSEGAPGLKGGKAPATASPAALPAYLAPERASPLWRKAWADLDIEHTLTPVRLAKTADPPEDAVRRALAGDQGALRGLGSDTNERTVLAYAEAAAGGRKLKVTLVGRDAVGWLSVSRSYPMHDGDVAYATELAAVVALGILEGRWKALRSSRGPTTGTVSADGVEGWSTSSDRDSRGDALQVSRPAASGSSGGDEIDMTVEFRGLGQWQQIRRTLVDMPGVDDLEIGQMSARTAAVRLRYPGGPVRLGADLEEQGLYLSNRSGQWLLQAR